MTEFSKKTGDYSTLSATDIKVMALTYQLEIEANGNEHIKTEPTIKKTIVIAPKPPGPSNVETLAGFYMPKSGEVHKLAEQVAQVSVQVDETNQTEEVLKSGNQDKPEDENIDSGKDEYEEEEYSTEEDESEDDEEEDDDDGGGWITPGNIEQVKHSMAGITETVQLEVACLTTDFAMQVSFRLSSINNCVLILLHTLERVDANGSSCGLVGGATNPRSAYLHFALLCLFPDDK